MNEDIEQNLPRGLAEKFLRSEQLAAQEPAADGPPCSIIGDIGRRLSTRRAAQGEVRVEPVAESRAAAPYDVMGVACGHDDMIEDIDPERVGERLESLRRANVRVARPRIAARVIMDNNERAGIELERAAKDRAGINGELAQRPSLQLFIGDEPVRGIEKQDAKRLIGKRAHRMNQIVSKGRREGIDRLGGDICLQSGGHRLACCREQLRDSGAAPEHTREGLRGLRPYLSQ